MVKDQVSIACTCDEHCHVECCVWCVLCAVCVCVNVCCVFVCVRTGTARRQVRSSWLQNCSPTPNKHPIPTSPTRTNNNHNSSPSKLSRPSSGKTMYGVDMSLSPPPSKGKSRLLPAEPTPRTAEKYFYVHSMAGWESVATIMESKGFKRIMFS